MENQQAQKIVLIEIGSRIIRMGFAADATPRVTISTPTSLSSSSIRSCSKTELCNICLDLFSSIFLDHLQIKSKESHVLIIEAAISTQRLRETIAMALYKYLFVGKVSFQPDILLPILATGCYTGIVVDIGAAETRALAVLHGRPLLHTLRIGAAGISHGEAYLKKAVDKDSKLFPGAALSELFCQVAALKGAVNIEASSGFKSITIPADVREGCLRVIIEGDDQVSSSALGGAGAAGVLLSCVLACAVDARCNVMRNVVVCGGGACFPGVASAVCAVATARALEPPAKAPGVRGGSDQRQHTLAQAVRSLEGNAIKSAPSPFLRSLLVWIGASVFASNKV